MTSACVPAGGHNLTYLHTYFHTSILTYLLTIANVYPQADIINRGFGGYNTRWALHMVEEIIASHKPQEVKLVTVFFGANDAAHSDRGA
jgi:lysophospholipase L1-like esterase